jgi:protein arginine N-methyltransferase 1
MYSISGYASMIGDRVRTAAYAEALRRTIRPGSVVLDLGTGAGLCALLACRHGAGRVYAVEPDNVIEVARAAAAANGCADRITFVQDLSTRVTLPERADVIVADLRGVLPLFGHHLPALADARRRHLAPGGAIIPLRDTLHAAVVEAPELHAAHLAPWADNDLGLDLRPLRRLLGNTWRKARIRPEQLLSEPRQWAELDYTTLDGAAAVGRAEWVVGRSAAGHGLACWFDATLAPSTGFSNAPGAPEAIYGQAFFPWPAAIELAPGDRVTAELHADLVGADYVWRWNTRVTGAAGRAAADLKQSTFLGTPLAADGLRKRAAEFVPAPTEDAATDLFILGLLVEGLPLGQIAGRLAARFPARFADWRQALTQVGDLSEKYSR